MSLLDPGQPLDKRLGLRIGAFLLSGRPVLTIAHMPEMKVPPRDRIVDFLARFIGEHGYSPSTREIAAGVGIPEANVRFHLGKLKEQGRVTYVSGQNRTVRLLPINATP